MILELKKIKSVTASTFSASICYEVIGPGAMILSCFFLAVPVLHCCAGFSLAAASGDYSLVVVHQLLIAGEGNGTRSSVLAWRIPGTGEPGGLLSVGSHRVGHD